MTKIEGHDWKFEQARANGLNVSESRAVWRLHRYHCWSVAEIAELFDFSQTFTHHALLKIAEDMEETK